MTGVRLGCTLHSAISAGVGRAACGQGAAAAATMGVRWMLAPPFMR